MRRNSLIKFGRIRERIVAQTLYAVGDVKTGHHLNNRIVLIVEDEPFIRMDAAETVRGAGFDVLEVSNADDAILVLEKRLDIAFVFTDIQMPGSMDGLKLAAAVRDRWPPILIIATSGNVRVTTQDLPEGGRFLPKPYNAKQLADLLHDLDAAA